MELVAGVVYMKYPTHDKSSVLSFELITRVCMRTQDDKMLIDFIDCSTIQDSSMQRRTQH